MLGYTRLPRPVRVRSWGGWVRNGIKITIRKMRLYKFIRLAYSQPQNILTSENGNYNQLTVVFYFFFFTPFFYH